jgi:hypothetical protein
VKGRELPLCFLPPRLGCFCEQVLGNSEDQEYIAGKLGWVTFTPMSRRANSSSDWYASFLKSVESLPPVLALAFFFFFGMLLMLGSFAAHLNAVTDTSSGKKFGYVYEINWAVNYIVFVPIALYFCIAALNSIHQTITRIADCGMVVNPRGETVNKLRLSDEWQVYGRRAIQSWLVATLIVVIAVAAEWWQVCAVPIFTKMDYTRTASTGWTLAPHLSGGQISSSATLVFGAFAFLAEATVVSAFLLFICVIFAFAAWVFGYTNEDAADELFPNPKSDDPRRGFESFQLLIENLLLAAVSLFFVFFMTRLHSAFVDSNATSVMSFMAGDIGKGFFDGVKNLVKSGDPDLFATGKHLGYSVAMVGSATALTIITGFLIPGTIVRQAAIRARDRFVDWAPRHAREVNVLYELTLEEAAPKLKSMVFWPVLYPRPVQLLLFAGLAAGCFVFYKFTLILVGVVLYAGLQQVVKVLSTGNR